MPKLKYLEGGFKVKDRVINTKGYIGEILSVLYPGLYSVDYGGFIELAKAKELSPVNRVSTNEITVTNRSASFKLSTKDHAIDATIFPNGSISLFSVYGRSSPRYFVFEKSKPELLEAVGKLFIEASKLKV